jgi:uncharacterized membrane protein YfcA
VTVPAIVIALAAAAAAATGFGFNLLSAPLLTFVYPAPRVVALTLLLGVCVSGLLALQPSIRRGVEWGVVRPLYLSSLCGMPLGVALLWWGRPQALKAAIAGLTAAFAIAMLARVRPRVGTGLAQTVLVGAVSGVLATSTSLSGPPVVLYLVARGLTKGGFRSNMVVYVFLSSVTSVVLLALGGSIDAATAGLAVRLLPALAVGFAGGMVAAHRLSDQGFERLVLGFLAVVGVLGLGAALR